VPGGFSTTFAVPPPENRSLTSTEVSVFFEPGPASVSQEPEMWRGYRDVAPTASSVPEPLRPASQNPIQGIASEGLAWARRLARPLWRGRVQYAELGMSAVG
jgi:hypothetical protein